MALHLEGVPAAVQLLEQLAPAGIAISIITYMEAYQGTLRSPDPPAAYAGLQIFAAQVPILPLALPVAERCAQIRETLNRQGWRVRARALDPIVAAPALGTVSRSSHVIPTPFAYATFARGAQPCAPTMAYPVGAHGCAPRIYGTVRRNWYNTHDYRDIPGLVLY